MAEQGFTRGTPVAAYKPLHITANGTLVPVGLCVNTTTSQSVAATGVQTITLTSTANVEVGRHYNIPDGASSEDVVPTSVTSTSITATFAFTHGSGVSFISRRGSYLGPVLVNSVGTGATLTLYNGNPNATPNAGAAIAVIPLAINPFPYGCVCEKGLFYTLASSAAPDVTLLYLDQTQ